MYHIAQTHVPWLAPGTDFKGAIYLFSFSIDDIGRQGKGWLMLLPYWDWKQ